MNAKRGYVPEDERYFSPAAIKTMKTASRHICYLLNEGYDLKQASTFVGNHFVLSERQRLAIARSVASNEQLKTRKAKEKTSLEGAEVWIDGFNTVITLEVMFSDSILFECMDGTVRDLAALRGTYRIIPETEKAVHALFDTLKEQNVKTARVLLDEPVSNSGRLKTLLAEIGEEYPFDLDIQILKAVDSTLWDKNNVITTDSIILDHCICWFNLIKICVQKHSAKTFCVWEKEKNYMELTGTLEERIAAMVEFAKAHRAYEYDHDKFVKRYRNAGVPYTEAAEKFCREWDGVLDHCRFSTRSKNRIDFRFVCTLDLIDGFDSSKEALRYWYDSDTRDKFGSDTVPVATGGYYYYDIIWIKPDGSLIAILPDYGGRVNYFGNLFEYLCSEFIFAGTPDFVECDNEVN